MQEKQFTSQFLILIGQTDLEYGFSSPLDVFLEERLTEDESATKNWLYGVFLEHLSDVGVVTAILRTIAHLRHDQMAPQGLAMALIASRHLDDEIQECAIRVCESWGGAECLRVLKNMTVEEGWVKDYLQEVIMDLEKED